MKFTEDQRRSAKNVVDYQQRILELSKKDWQEKWEAAENPFVALLTWYADKPIRDAAYLPWEIATNQALECGPPAK